MSLRYELEKDGNLVVARATDVLALADFMSMATTMRSDADLKSPHETLDPSGNRSSPGWSIVT